MLITQGFPLCLIALIITPSLAVPIDRSDSIPLMVSSAFDDFVGEESELDDRYMLSSNKVKLISNCGGKHPIPLTCMDAAIQCREFLELFLSPEDTALFSIAIWADKSHRNDPLNKRKIEAVGQVLATVRSAQHDTTNSHTLLADASREELVATLLGVAGAASAEHLIATMFSGTNIQTVIGLISSHKYLATTSDRWNGQKPVDCVKKHLKNLFAGLEKSWTFVGAAASAMWNKSVNISQWRSRASKVCLEWAHPDAGNNNSCRFQTVEWLRENLDEIKISIAGEARVGSV